MSFPTWLIPQIVRTFPPNFQLSHNNDNEKQYQSSLSLSLPLSLSLLLVLISGIKVHVRFHKIDVQVRKCSFFYSRVSHFESVGT